MIKWEIVQIDKLLCTGTLSSALLRANVCDASMSDPAGTLPAARVQLVPLVRDHALALLQQSAHARDTNQPASVEFAIDRDALTIVQASADTRARSAVSLASVVDTRPLLCKLEVLNASPLPSSFDILDSSWFDAKLRRASDCRLRGNDAFKRNELERAIRTYKQALRWLACPVECAYDATERAAVNPIAAVCLTNLATSYWSLHNANATIVYATRALQCDPQHVKALYKRSQALVATKAFQDAIRDLERAQSLAPQHKLVRSALEQTRKAQVQFLTKHQQAFAKGF